MASRLAHPGVLAFLSGLKGATGAMVSERDRRRALQEKERDRSRAFQDNLSMMSARQKMDLSTAQQTDAMREASVRRGKEWERSLPPTPAEQAELDKTTAYTGYLQAQAAGVETPAERKEREEANRRMQVQAALEARMAQDREQLERTAMMAENPEDGIAYLKAGVKLLGAARVAELTALLKEKQKQLDHQKAVDKVRGIFANPANTLTDEDRQRIAKGYGISVYEATGEEPPSETKPWLSPYDPNIAGGAPSDADRVQMAGTPMLGGPAVPGATNPQEAQDWAAQQGGAVPPMRQGGAENTAGLTPEDVEVIRQLAQQWGVDFNTARARAESQLSTQ